MENVFDAISLEPSPPKSNHHHSTPSASDTNNNNTSNGHQRNPRAKFLLSLEEEQESKANNSKPAVIVKQHHQSDDFNFDQMEVSAMNFDKSKIIAKHRLKHHEEDDDDDDYLFASSDSNDNNFQHNLHPPQEDGANAALDLQQISSGDTQLGSSGGYFHQVMSMLGGSGNKKNGTNDLIQVGSGVKKAARVPSKKPTDLLSYLNDDDDENNDDTTGSSNGTPHGSGVFNHHKRGGVGGARRETSDDFGSPFSNTDGIEPLEGIFGHPKSYHSKAPDDTIRELLEEVDREELNGSANNFTTLLLKQEKEERERKRRDEFEVDDSKSHIIQAALKRIGTADTRYKFTSGHGKGLFDHEKKLPEKELPAAPGQELDASVPGEGGEDEEDSKSSTTNTNNNSHLGASTRSSTQENHARKRSGYETQTRQFMQNLFDEDSDKDKEDEDDKIARSITTAEQKESIIQIENASITTIPVVGGNRSTVSSAYQASSSNTTNLASRGLGGAYGSSGGVPITTTVIVRETTNEQLEEFEGHTRRLLKDAEFESFMVIRQCYQMMTFQLQMFARKTARLQEKATRK